VNPGTSRHRSKKAIRPLAPILIAAGFVVPALLVVSLVPERRTVSLALVAISVLGGFLARSIVAREVSHGRSALSASVELYRRLFDEAYDAVVIADPAGGAVLDANRIACGMFGYTRKEMRGLRLRQLQPEECGDRLTAAAGGTLHPERRDVADLLCVRKGGERFRADLRGGIILVNSRPYAAWIVRDAREQQDLQEQVRQSERMESVANLAGRFAHGFNNLLTGIMGYTRLILDRLSPDELIRRPLDAIERSATRAAELTGELLTFSRRAAIRPVPNDLNRIVRDELALLRSEAPANIEFVLDCASDLKTSAVDAAPIGRVVRQLCSNAWEAMPDGGRLSVATGNCELLPEDCRSNLEARPGQFVTLAVRDTGQGIAPEARGRLFEPFFSTRKSGDRAGLGLATVYGTVKSHEGWVEVNSAPGKGTSFVVYLPVWSATAYPQAVDPGIAAAAPDPRAGETAHSEPPAATILVVDDESMVLALARDVLEMHRYRVVTARHGEEALRVYRERPGGIDLVLLDLTMPVMGGEECFRRLRQLDPGVRVVISSGFSSESSASKVLRDGALDFVQKPFDINGLALTIERALRRTPRIPTAAAS